MDAESSNETPEMSSANIERIYNELIHYVTTNQENKAASDQAFLYFKNLASTKIKKLEDQSQHYESKFSEVNETNKRLNLDYKSLEDDLLAANRKIREIEHNQQDSVAVSQIKEKVKKQFDEIKSFNYKRLEFYSKLNKIADDCVEKLKIEKVELDKSKCEMDFEKELNEKLLIKLKLIKSSFEK